MTCFMRSCSICFSLVRAAAGRELGGSKASRLGALGRVLDRADPGRGPSGTGRAMAASILAGLRGNAFPDPRHLG
jgi:hypothetical protein